MVVGQWTDEMPQTQTLNSLNRCKETFQLIAELSGVQLDHCKKVILGRRLISLPLQRQKKSLFLLPPGCIWPHLNWEGRPNEKRPIPDKQSIFIGRLGRQSTGEVL